MNNERRLDIFAPALAYSPHSRTIPCSSSVETKTCNIPSPRQCLELHDYPCEITTEACNHVNTRPSVNNDFDANPKQSKIKNESKFILQDGLLSSGERYLDSASTERTSAPNHLHSFKNPNSEVSYGTDYPQTTETIRSPYVGFSPVATELSSAKDSQPCNGSVVSLAHERSHDCNTPNAECFSDFNGRSGSHTPASDVDRTKMDLTKLDETIDYVLAIARSDEPCEGMFVLSCRSREPVHLSSPNVRVNTPSSGLLTSPTPSPTSSPHSTRVPSPTPNPIFRQHSLLQSCNVSASSSAQTFPRIVVEKAAGLMHAPPHGNAKCLPNQCNSNSVSLLHLYSDSLISSTPASANTLSSSFLRSLSNVSAPMLLQATMTPENRTRIQQNHPSLVNIPSNSPIPSVFPPSKPSTPTFNSQVTKVVVPSCPPHSAAFERSGQSSCRTVLHSPPLCIVPNVKQTTPLIRDITSVNSTLFNDSPVVSGERIPPRSNDTFRQPIAPTLPSTSLFSPICSSSCKMVSNALCASPPSAASKPSTPNPVVTSLKRKDKSMSMIAKKRRTSMQNFNRGAVQSVSTSGTQPASSATRTVHPDVLLKELKTIEPKSLVTAPVLQPYSTVLPPLGGADISYFGNSQDEEKSFGKKGVKYSRGSFALTRPKCYNSSNGMDNVDEYILQHLQSTTPSCPLVRDSTTGVRLRKDGYTVCSSPKPLSFENNMELLFHSMHKPLSSSRYSSEHQPNKSTEIPENSFPSELVSMLTDDLIHGKSERSTPPLPLFHMPNPRLICQPIHLSTSETRKNAQSFGAIKFDKHPKSVPSLSNLPELRENSAVVERNKVLNGPTDITTPLIDLETGEVVFTSKSHPEFPSNLGSEGVDADKLRITFTTSSSVSPSIPKLIGHISNVLNIDESTIQYQMTRNGVQVVLDETQKHCKGAVKNLENSLREQFMPLSVQFGTQPLDSMASHPPVVDASHDLPGYCETTLSFSPVSSDSLAIKSEDTTPASVNGNKAVDDSASVALLTNVKKESKRSCIYCDKPVLPHTAHRRCFDELSQLIGLSTNAVLSTESLFCSSSCVLSYSRSVAHSGFTISDSQLRCPGIPLCGIVPDNVGDARMQALDLVGSIPVFLHGNAPKAGRNASKRPSTSAFGGVAAKRRNNATAFGIFKSKKWNGSRWRSFSTDASLQPTIIKHLPDTDSIQLPNTDSSTLCISTSSDMRRCLLCSLVGDGNENGPGRLLPLDADSWVHINCALWCYEVYETVSGSLNNVEPWFKKAQETNCSHCGRLGAGLPCYNPRCSFCYHVPCAINAGCMFFTDRGMYCPQHQPKEDHPMQLHALNICRRVYVARDENAQVGDVIRDEDRTFATRIGSVSLHNLGQLLPHQIDSGFFHTKRHIYPVGFRTTRLYWSMRRVRCRARYRCVIEELHSRPLFRVTAEDDGMPDLTFVQETCNGVWQLILSRIEKLREENKLIRLFPKHLRGEDLFGLSEPHIVRAVESLPGIDGLRDYVFNFGRMELITGMPLAVNPTGCARSEPKMQTYVKRSKGESMNGLSVCSSRTNVFPGLRRSAHPHLSSLSELPSKQHQSSRSQQYRRLRTEFTSNVILGRSRIQGLGLFAARDLEPQTMVIEYIGELIRVELANKREKHYEAHNRGIYMFRLDDDTVIDASMSGGLARYVNHSCQPNCYAEYFNFGDQSHIVIITNQHIEKSEELCYDYNFDLEDGGSKIPCLCRAPNCRKWMN